MDAIQMPFTPAQLEILKVLARPMKEQELLELKRLIVRFFAKQLVREANEVWDKKGWEASDTKRLSRRHLRTPYKSTSQS